MEGPQDVGDAAVGVCGIPGRGASVAAEPQPAPKHPAAARSLPPPLRDGGESRKSRRKKEKLVG